MHSINPLLLTLMVNIHFVKKYFDVDIIQLTIIHIYNLNIHVDNHVLSVIICLHMIIRTEKIVLNALL